MCIQRTFCQLNNEFKTQLTKKQIYRRQYYLDNKEKATKQIKTRYILKKEELLQYQKDYRKANRIKVRQTKIDKINSRRNTAIQLLGGMCVDCKTVFPSYVYDFHHVNPLEKEFTISENMGVAKERFYREVSKCILLCANCHRIEHNKEKNAK